MIIAKIVMALATVLTLGLAPTKARADDRVQFGAHDVHSVFSILKSQNRNQVHYGVHLDAECHPVGAHPVFAYWQMLENGGAIEPLLGIEDGAYGLDDEQQLQPGKDGDPVRIVIKLRAFRERALTLEVSREGGRCQARAHTSISGADAKLDSIYVRLRWPFGVAYVLVTGSRIADGRWLQEKVSS